MQKMNVPYSYLTEQYRRGSALREHILVDLNDLMDDGQYTLGWPVKRFERAFEKTFKVKHAIGVSNGTDALALSLVALGLNNQNQWVAAPSATFVATIGAILQAGANVRLVDVDPQGLIDKSAAHRTPARCVIGVDWGGMPVSWDSDNNWLEGKHFIRDAAQSIGASINGVSVANLGECVCFSLHPLKNLNVMGDGGVIATNDDALAKELRLLRNHGLADRDTVARPGFNHRLSSLQAISAYWQLALPYTMENLDWVIEQRIRNARSYDTWLKKCPMVQISPRIPEVKAVYHLYVIQAERRNDLVRYLQSQGIEAKVNYPVPCHLQPGFAFLGYGSGSLPETERQAQRIISLPIHQYLRDEQIEYAATCIQSFYQDPEKALSEATANRAG